MDARYDLAEPSDKWGVAPRLGGGTGPSGATSATIVYGGVVGSYEPFKALGLYGGGDLRQSLDPQEQAWLGEAACREREAAASGWGDGVLQVTVGAVLAPRAKASFYVEYSLREPMQDHPGDRYRFARSPLAALGIGFQGSLGTVPGSKPDDSDCTISCSAVHGPFRVRLQGRYETVSEKLAQAQLEHPR